MKKQTKKEIKNKLHRRILREFLPYDGNKTYCSCCGREIRAQEFMVFKPLETTGIYVCVCTLADFILKDYIVYFKKIKIKYRPDTNDFVGSIKSLAPTTYGKELDLK